MRLRRTSIAALTVALTVTGFSGLAAAAAPPTIESEVTDDGAYVRHDGGTDPAITECSNPATAPDDPATPTARDADPTDGGNRRQGNEPAVAIDPTNPNVLAAGWNDYCQADLAAGWQGLGFSTDRGATWTDSIVPGYPLDDSAEGSLSPLKGRTDAGDPLVAFDSDGRLFVGGIAFNRAKPQLGDVWVATYGATPAGGLPKDYLRTRVVGQGTPAVNGIFQDKPMLEVDRTGGINDGNVYVCWSRFIGVGNGTTKIYFSRSTDHGVTFSKGIGISRDKQVQGCDIAVEGDGDVYVSWRTANTQRPTDTTSMTVTRSTDGGASFATPRVAAAFTQYFPQVGGARDCGDGAFFCGEPGYVFHRVPLECGSPPTSPAPSPGSGSPTTRSTPRPPLLAPPRTPQPGPGSSDAQSCT